MKNNDDNVGTTWQRGVLKNANETILARATMIAASQVGKPYATFFNPPSSGSFYCSSLVEFAYQEALRTPHVFVDERFTLIFEPRSFWTQYYKPMPLPVNASGSNPTLLLHSPDVFASEVIRHH